MIRLTEKATLPQIAFSAAKRRWAPAGEPGLKLILVKSALQEALGDWSPIAAHPFGMEVKGDATMITKTLHDRVIAALLNPGPLEKSRDPVACGGISPRGHVPDMLESLALAGQ
jgi:hypothetical protein